MPERVFAMPDLGEGLEAGRVVTWLVAQGENVTLNQPLVEVETAKAAVEIPSPFSGRVLQVHAEEGQDVAVGSPLVTFETVEGAPSTTAGAATLSSGVAATPPVRRLAKDLGVDLTTLIGSGPDGRITEADVRSASSGSSPSVGTDSTRRAIAAALERQALVPQVTTFRTVDCSALEPYRKELGVSPLPVLVCALCAIVTDHPLLDARWSAGDVQRSEAVHMGIAADTDRGLVVPVIRDAQAKGIVELAAEIDRLASAARNGSLSPGEIAGATIAVSNTGSYGSEAGTPLLAPGTAVTLALGLIAPRALVVDGEVVARAAVTISMTFDHRVLDGADAGRALTSLVDLLQSADRLRDLPR
jgi:2-oxoisovalerate dehydrogenase E2 component (dihydrolipoyl transacylase)